MKTWILRQTSTTRGVKTDAPWDRKASKATDRQQVQSKALKMSSMASLSLFGGFSCCTFFILRMNCTSGRSSSFTFDSATTLASAAPPVKLLVASTSIIFWTAFETMMAADSSAEYNPKLPEVGGAIRLRWRGRSTTLPRSCESTNLRRASLTSRIHQHMVTLQFNVERHYHTYHTCIYSHITYPGKPVCEYC